MKCLLIYVFLMAVAPQARSKTFNVDLRNRGLISVPTSISPSILTLDLSNNLMKVITNDSFITLSVLTKLDLSYNFIQTLEASALSGLSELTSLKLNNNRLLLNYETYPVTVFHPLRNLRYLDLAKNKQDTIIQVAGKNTEEYPTKIFTKLKTLTALSIDGMKGVNFGPGFLRMSKLNSLSVYCSDPADVLRLETITVFLNLTIQDLSLDCNTIEAGLLAPFKNLTRLSLRTESLDQSLALLVGVRNRNMTSVRISESNPGEFLRSGIRPENMFLTRNNTAHLATICVKHLNLNKNFIVHIDTDVFMVFQHPECLESLDVGDNFFIGTHLLLFFSLVRFPNLKYISFSSERVHAKKKRDIYSSKITDNRNLMEPKLLSFFLPSSVEFINASYTGGRMQRPKFPDLRMVNGSHLRTLDLAYCGIHDCSLRVTGVPNLTVLNMSGFDCSSSAPNVLQSFWNLEVLTARDCRMAESFEHDYKHIAFRSLVRLRILDLSDNNLISIHKDLFKPLIQLEILLLANNKLSYMPESVLTLASLSFIDLSSNVFISISSKVIEKLTYSLPSQNKTFTISLSQNPFLCTCHTREFLQWYFSTDIIIPQIRSLTCTLNNGTVTKIWNLWSEIDNMNVECVSKFWLIMSIVGSCVLTVSMVLGIFGYRFRWNIKYWILTKCRRGGPIYEELAMEQYQFDAFVAYNYQNYQWACIVLRNVLETENNYSLCLHDRDFPVGASIQQNIVDAVNNSRKVILVINRAFLTSDWCEFEIQMAGMRMVRDGRENAIIVIMMEEIPVAEMPRSLLNLWKHITFLLWTNDQTDEDIFWNRLLEVMGRY